MKGATERNYEHWIKCAMEQDWREVSVDAMENIATAMGWKPIARHYEAKREPGGWDIFFNGKPLTGEFRSTKAQAEARIAILKEEEYP